MSEEHQGAPRSEIRFSLRFKLVGLITLAILTTGILIVGQDFRRSNQSLDGELKKRGQLIAANLADAARPLLVAGSSALTDVCASFADQGDVAYIIIAAPDGRMLSHVIRDDAEIDETFMGERVAALARIASAMHGVANEALHSPRATELYASQAPVMVQSSAAGGDEALFGLTEPTAADKKGQAKGKSDKHVEAVVEIGLSLAPVQRVERDLLMIDLGIVGVVALLGLLAAWVIAGLVVRPLNEVAAAAESVAAGNFQVSLPARARGDEINQLSLFFNHMTRQLAMQRHRLTGLTDELTKQRDHERGLRDLALVINAASSINELVDGLFQRIAMVAPVDAGAFYNFDEDLQQLVPVGAYGLALDKVAPLTPGDGLVGEAAKQRKMRQTANVPARAIRVLGEEAPARSVLAVPIVFQDKLLAVLELATFSTFEQEHLAFFTALAEQSAVALNNFYTRGAVRLARELAAKKVELENQNFELNRLNEEIQRANQHKSIFLANMSHELRTPLNAIIGFTRLVLKKAVSTLPAQQYENLLKVEKSAGHLLSIINDILDIAKVEAGRLDVSAERFALKELVDEILAASTPLVGGKPLKLDSRLPHDLPELETDRGRLRQILVNLVTNAVKFTNNGSVTVDVEYVAENDRVRIAVVDTGIGIVAADQTLVFEAFRQVDNSTTRKVGGTGLGLTIVKKLTELLGGDIALESTVGIGSRFVLELPRLLAKRGGEAGAGGQATETTGAASPAPVVAGAASGGDARRSVVIIEDNAEDAQLLQELLTELDFAVHTARDGEHGLRLVNEVRPTLVTVDIMMPGWDGWKVLDEIRINPTTREMPVIVISSVAAEREAFARARGASGCLSKPVSIDALREALTKELQ